MTRTPCERAPRAGRPPARVPPRRVASLFLLLAALGGCAADGARRSVSTPMKAGRLVPLTSSTLSSFQAAFDGERDVLRYIVVFSPT